MEFFAAGFGDDVHHPPGILSILSAVVAGLYAELLKRIRERKRLVHAEVFVDVIAAIEHEVSVRGACAVH